MDAKVGARVHKTPEVTRLIHENFWTVLSYILAQPAASKLLEDRFKGEWKYLSKTIFVEAEVRADRALLEMATQLRVLDDAEGLSERLKAMNAEPLGTVTQRDGEVTAMHFRDMTNKVMHAASFEWRLAGEGTSILCRPHDGERWIEAEIQMLPLTALIGELMF